MIIPQGFLKDSSVEEMAVHRFGMRIRVFLKPDIRT